MEYIEVKNFVGTVEDAICKGKEKHYFNLYII